jgi:hypothetical protein
MPDPLECLTPERRRVDTTSRSDLPYPTLLVRLCGYGRIRIPIGYDARRFQQIRNWYTNVRARDPERFRVRTDYGVDDA